MIAQKTIQEVFETARIEEVVEDFVSLRKRGANMIGLCPFHNEKTPSFTVSPSKNLFKCFGCGKGGNTVTFIMEHEHFSFPEAIRFLAKKYHIEIEEKERTPEELEAQQLHESLFIVNEFAGSWFSEQLFGTDRGKSVGLKYFRDRGYREEIIRKFGLGYAPDNRDGLTKLAVEKGFKIDQLRQLGLTTQYDRDFFRDRVMFTIHNLSGKPVAFAGRILAQKAKAPKYINSPESEIYNKSKTLYGLFQAKQAIRKFDECILVEGYTDVLTLHQAGIEQVVASSGTSLTTGQLGLIKRYTPNLKILYDGDPAGIKAALRGLDLALEQDLNVRIVLLPEGEDPDSFLQRSGGTVFEKYLEENAKDFILFKADLLLKETGDDPVRKAGLIKELVGSIARIPDPIKRSLYIQECAKEMNIGEEILVEELQRTLQKQFRQARYKEQASRRDESEAIARSAEPKTETSPNRKPAEKTRVGDEFQEKDIARILIAHGGEIHEESNTTVAEYILTNIQEVADKFDDPVYQLIVNEVIDLLSGKKKVTTAFFVNHPEKKVASTAVELIQSPHEMSEGWEKHGIFLRTQKHPDQNFTSDSRQALLRFKRRKVSRLLREIKDKLNGSGSREEGKLLKAYSHYKQIDIQISKELRTVIHPD